jgi:hypothetical protein
VGLIAGVVPAILSFFLGVFMGVPIPTLTVEVVTYAFMMGLCGGTVGLVSTLFGEVVTTQRESRLLHSNLPICSHCHRIRMENQEWIRLEAFFHNHSDTQLSHGICPSCLEENLPEEFEAMQS